MTEANGWDASARAWIDVIGDDGDWGRRYVLDAPMLARATRGRFRSAIDIGCGEGRFCRMLQAHGIATTGIDPTAALIERARLNDPRGDYRIERAEALSAPDETYELAVAYLSLIDISDLGSALAQIYRVLRPGGSLLIANLQSFNTASVDHGWSREPDGTRRFSIDRYMEEREVWEEWRGIRIRNWHRPMQAYLGGLLDAGFALRHFAEPEPGGIAGEKAARYRRVPNFLIMEWEKTSGVTSASLAPPGCRAQSDTPGRRAVSE